MIFSTIYLTITYVIGTIFVVLLRYFDLLSNGLLSNGILSKKVLFLIWIFSPIIVPITILAIIIEKIRYK